MRIDRAWAMPSAWTFTIKPIANLLQDEGAVGLMKQGVWVDPFAGMNSPADITNDLNPKANAQYHLDAIDFAIQLDGMYDGVLFDPPYSYRQISEHYREAGIKASSLDTSSNFYNRVMNALADKIKKGGKAISFGWCSNGFGKNRGFEIVRILLVAHGGHHNDTICTVERKL